MFTSQRPTGALDPRSSDAAERAAIRHWLAVQALFALRPEQAAKALRARPDPEALLAAAGRAAPDRRSLERDADRLARLEVRLVPMPSPGYPERLRQLSDAPPLLAVRGDPEALRRRAVALVGARAASAYGLAVARRLGAELAAAGLVVVSGLARGVDAAAHEGALEAGGATAAFLACGPDRVYPLRHRRLAARVAGAGAVASELPPGTPPLPGFFPLRNRLISAVAEAVVVVEARERSGSLTTARHAADQGVDVLAVPGPIDAPTSRGANGLLRDGAGVVLEAADVLRALGLAVRAAAPPAVPADPDAGLAGPPRAVLRILARGPRSRDELARALAQPPGELALALVELELRGRVREDRDGRLRLVSPDRGQRL